VTTRPFGTIRKLASGRYQARYSHLGHQVSADTTFATKAAARAWLAGVETDLGRGQHVDPSLGRVSFEAFATTWLDQRKLRPRTRETYESQLAHIVCDFGPIELRQITPADVRAWHGRLLKSGLHANTVAKVYRLFRTMLGTAVDDGLLRSNPVHIKSAAVEHAIERPILEWDQVRRLAQVIEPRFSALIWTAAASGLRFGELTGLTRRHVDLDAATLQVEQALTTERGKGAVVGAPKSIAAYRVVAIPETAVDVLRRHIDTFTGDDIDSFIFTSVKGRPLLNQYFAGYWKRALAAAEVDEAVRFHDLRHLAGTTAASAGASLREIMARMGHASSDASLRYLKASERRDGEIANAIEERMTRDLDQGR